MTIHIEAEYNDGVAPSNFYPKMNPVKVATGGAGDLAGGGWSVDTWATVVQISVAKSDGTWESQAVAPLGGSIPVFAHIIDVGTGVPYRGRVVWTNSTSSYKVNGEVYELISGVWTLDHTFTNAATGQTTEDATSWRADAGSQYRTRARYTDGTNFGDWTSYANHTFPT